MGFTTIYLPEPPAYGSYDILVTLDDYKDMTYIVTFNENGTYSQDTIPELVRIDKESGLDSGTLSVVISVIILTIIIIIVCLILLLKYRSHSEQDIIKSIESRRKLR